MNVWQQILSVPPPPTVAVVVSNGPEWRRATRLPSGRYNFEGKPIQPLYWCLPPALPRPAYTDTSGATVIPLTGLSRDIHLVAQPGDELWTTETNDFSDGESPYLIFEQCLAGAVSLRQYRSGCLWFYEWADFGRLLRALGGDTCYLRRPAVTK